MVQKRGGVGDQMVASRAKCQFRFQAVLPDWCEMMYEGRKQT